MSDSFNEKTHPPKHSWLELPGLKLQILEWPGTAPKDAPVILFCHGWLDLGAAWARVAPHFTGRYRVFSFDFRGMGRSSWLRGGDYHFPDYVQDIAEVADHLMPGGEKFYLVGHSMGGMATSLYAGTFPERIVKYVNIEGLGPPPVGSQAAPDRYKQWIGEYRKFRSKKPKPYPGYADIAERLGKMYPKLDREFAMFLAQEIGEKAPDGTVHFAHDPVHKVMNPNPFNLEQNKAFWQRVACPVLCVRGGDSDFNRKVYEDRVVLFPNGKYAVVPGAGHMVHYDQPVLLAKTIGDFFEG